MFKIKRFMTFFGAAMLLILTSCEFGSLEKREASGSVVVDLSSVKDRITSSSRTAYKDLLSSDFETFADLKLEGDFETSQTINLNETEIVQIDNIPVGSKITASIEIYINIDLQDEGRSFKETMWHGTSEVYEIKDGPNEIVIPLSRGGAEIDEPEDTKIKIWVTYDEHKQYTSLSTLTANYFAYGGTRPEEEEGRDGKTKDTAFHYIISAIKWIADNGNSNEDYKIVLTGYGIQDAFNQGVSIGDEVKGHAKSITITSSDPEHVAIRATTYPVFLMVHPSNSNPGPVPVIFENIQIAPGSTGGSDTSTLILSTDNDSKCDVTLGKNTVFLREDGNTIKGGAIAVGYGSTVTMEENAKIYNFEAQSGAAFSVLRNSHITMNGRSNIDFCKTSWYGGAIFCSEQGELVEMNDNSSITNCSSESGGAVYLKSGSFTMYSGTISGCNATNYGGAIYSSTESKDTYCYLYGGTISGNKAGYNGGAVYIKAKDEAMDKTARLKMRGDICVDPGSDYKNDIFNAGPTLELDDELTTENPVAALLTRSSLTAEYTIITASNTDIIERSYSKIKVRCEDGESPTGYSSIYDLTSAGKPDMP